MEVTVSPSALECTADIVVAGATAAATAATTATPAAAAAAAQYSVGEPRAAANLLAILLL